MDNLHGQLLLDLSDACQQSGQSPCLSCDSANVRVPVPEKNARYPPAGAWRAGTQKTTILKFFLFSRANLRVSFLLLLCFYSGKRVCKVFKARTRQEPCKHHFQILKIMFFSSKSKGFISVFPFCIFWRGWFARCLLSQRFRGLGFRVQGSGFRALFRVRCLSQRLRV